MPEEDGACSLSHTKRKPLPHQKEAPPPGREAQGRNPPWLLSQQVCTETRDWNLLNRNGWVSVPGGGRRGLKAKQRSRKWGEPGMGHEREPEKGKGLSTMWRLDWAQGLGPRRRQNTRRRLERGQCPAWPTHYQTLAVLHKPGATQGAGPSPQSGLTLASLKPPPLPPPPQRATSH